MEDTALELEQIEIIFGFERASELFEDSVSDFRNGKTIGGKKVNLISSLNPLLGISIHLYSFCLAYHNSNPKLENIKIYKHGFKFNIKKMKWWL
jgi:hypothetical protein